MLNSKSIDSIMTLLNSDLCLTYDLDFCTLNPTSHAKFENESYT
jgi:hypothetical protein